ncbi:MotA/TolQ/ExbB proton channel family protein [Flavobacterium sp. J27]|uniref:MotA/TolQ/ExbB proton channel family protein n=1 Tax=Flavobacterium sp. J27 TaxID=2060419 RepID=UPI0010310566|nr:MotA/TolQ/ExbB proton channel family protein [Flavobacterium sp. J27]
MKVILDRIYEGGPFFMVPIAFILIAILVLLVWALLKRETIKKCKELIASLSLFVLVWGFLGQSIGLISAFDAIQSLGNITTEILAGGLKVTFLTVVFGMFTFLVGRVGIIILTIIDKSDK